MPIYEYRCETCGETFETMQKVSDPPLTTCGPLCRHPGDGGGTVRRLMSAHNVGSSASSGSAGFEPGMSCGRPGPGCEA